jgi:hypothetical protein
MSNKDHKFNKYNSTSGLSTKEWGPSGWYFLFSCIMGAYPVKIDVKNKQHLIIKKHFKRLLLSLSHTMPCIFCRQSFKQFCKKLPIDNFLSDRISLMKWLYEIRNLVNQKLIKQEQKCYNDEKKRLKQIYHQNPSENAKKEYYEKLNTFREKTFITKSSPPFEEVLNKYESIRAVCSKTAKTCSLPK